MSVSWSTITRTQTQSNVVKYGTSPTSLNMTGAGDSRNFTVDSGRQWSTHVANMTGLTKGQRYYYKVGDDKGAVWSKVFNFKAPTDEKPTPGKPELHIVYGDMGASHAYSLCADCGSAAACECKNQTIGVVSERSADMILHLGDFAYNMDTDNGVNGDIFMRNIEQIAAYIPYMTSVGNHENSAKALAHYTESFRNMPSNSGSIASANGLSRNNWWYSWNAGLVHYVAISTELYFGVGPSDACSQQFAFLKADLAKANRNRDKQPWIVVHGHRSIYCSCDGDCDGSATTVRDGIPGKCGGLEELFFKNGVDFFLNGAFVPPAAHDLARSGGTAHSRLWEREDLVSYVHLSIGLVLMSHRWLTP